MRAFTFSQRFWGDLVSAFLIGLLSLIATCGVANAQGTLSDVEVRSSVIPSDPSGNYGFAYRVSSGPSSVENVWSLEIDVSRPASALYIPSQGLVIAGAPQAASRPLADYAADLGLVLSDVVPVGCEPPVAWGCALTTTSLMRFAMFDLADSIAPGAGLSGFTIKSPALPAILDSVVRPYFVYQIQGDFAQESDSEAAELAKIGRAWTAKTLGPRPPPRIPDLPAFVAALNADVTQARSLDWISTDARADSIKAQLLSIENALLDGRLTDAQAETDVLVADVASTSCTTISCTGQSISSEGYALITFNAEYARSKMVDSDADGVLDFADGCSSVANGAGPLGLPTADADQDGYGNACDGDFDDNFAVTSTDFGTFLGCFGVNPTGTPTGPEMDPLCTESDMRFDTAITAIDFGRFLQQLGGPPGPSGLACAGTSPCP